MTIKKICRQSFPVKGDSDTNSESNNSESGNSIETKSKKRITFNLDTSDDKTNKFFCSYVMGTFVSLLIEWIQNMTKDLMKYATL